MITKEQIFENIDQYSVQELLNYIKKGIVTLPELADPKNTYGEFKPKVRREVEELLKNAEPEDWNMALTQNTIEGYQEYLNNYPNGVHRSEAREKKDILEDKMRKEKADKIRIEQESELQKEKIAAASEWNAVKKSDKRAIKEYIIEHPHSPYVKDAQNLLDDFENKKYVSYGMDALKSEILEIMSKKEILDRDAKIAESVEKALQDADAGIDKDDLLDELEDDHNFLQAKVVKTLVEHHQLSYHDLEDIGIPHAFIQKLARNTTRIQFETPPAFESIARKSTEIYFWGIPSSGKTCALGAILSVAENGQIAKAMIKDTECQGFDYMNRLPMCFNLNHQASTLPMGTPTMATYEMGFDLIDHDDKVHPITCVDFAGELMTCIYKVTTGKTLTNQQSKTLETLTNVLIDKRTGNRKIHFFVVEYGAEDRLYDGLPQRNYLDTVVNFIDNKNIFKTSTDAIFLIVTKVDKIRAKSKEERNELLKAYVKMQYGGFYNGLSTICKKYQINGGKISILPFSLGKVCFQDYCMFKEAYANTIVDIILSRSYKYNLGRRGTFESIFRG